MPAVQQAIDRARRAWNLALALGMGGASLGQALLPAGVVVLLGKVAGWNLTGPVLAAAVVVALGLARWRYRRSRVGEHQIATLLDLRLGGQGQLLHALESGTTLPLPDSVDALTHPVPDRRRLVMSLAPGLVFFVAAALIPPRIVSVQQDDPLAAQRIEELQELAQVLAQTLELDEELREEVAENLASAEQGVLDDELQGELLHEALDHIEQRLEQASRQMAGQIEATRREALAVAAATNRADVSEAQTLAELSELAKELERLGALPEGLTAEDLAGLSPAELAQQLDAAALAKLAQLAERGLLDPGALADAGELTPLTALPPMESVEGDPGGT